MRIAIDAEQADAGRDDWLMLPAHGPLQPGQHAQRALVAYLPERERRIVL